MFWAISIVAVATYLGGWIWGFLAFCFIGFALEAWE